MMLPILAAWSALLLTPTPPAACGPEITAIIEAARSPENQAYDRLRVLCDTIGNRLSGTAALERAVDWARRTLEADGHSAVRLQPVQVRHWRRGAESADMVAPRAYSLSMLGLGGSVGTAPGGLTAEVVVATDEASFEALGDTIRGRIVLFNNPMPDYHPERGSGYGKTVRFRTGGPRMAAAKGAVAVLVRSVTAHSLRTPHTGATRYGDAERRIPAAALSTEDADLIARLVEAGEPVRVHLEMEARDLGPKPSFNVIAELRGRERPDEIVVMAAHLDSWDVGQGAHDDGAGVVMAMEALSLIRRLGLKPRRTLRVVLFTNEENGLAGAFEYAKQAEIAQHVAAIEADNGGFAPTGFTLNHADKDAQRRGLARLSKLAQCLAPIGATGMKAGFGGADIMPLRKQGVPALGLKVKLDHYFDYHHTPADTFDKIVKADLHDSVASMAVMAWLLAELPERLDAR